MATSHESSMADALLQARYGTPSESGGAGAGAGVGPAGAGASRAHAAPHTAPTNTHGAPSRVKSPDILSQHLNAISQIPVTRIVQAQPEVQTAPSNRTMVASDPSGESGFNVSPHARKWDPAAAPSATGRKQGHDATVQAHGSGGKANDGHHSESRKGHDDQKPPKTCCCFKDSIDPRPLSEEKQLLEELGPSSFWDISPMWRVPLCSCESIKCFVCATVCPCCTACYMRSKVLDGHHGRYLVTHLPLLIAQVFTA